jgi:hypothetical protein
MGYWRQFDKFDPISGKVPHSPFHDLGSVVSRARRILKSRNADEIREIASTIDAEIDAFFEAAKQQAIDDVISSERVEFLIFDDEGNVKGVDPERIDELDFTNKDNTDDFEALQMFVDDLIFNAFLDSNKPNCMEYEYFAVLGLWHAAESITDLQFSFDFVSGKYVEKDRAELSKQDITSAANLAIKATEIVNYAETLQKMTWLRKKYDEQIKSLQLKQKEITSDDITRFKDQITAELLAEKRKQLSVAGKKRHEGNHKAKDIVLSMWGENPKQFDSAEKAADHYLEVLRVKGIKMGHRTVAKWIRAEAKAKNIRFR